MSGTSTSRAGPADEEGTVAELPRSEPCPEEGFGVGAEGRDHHRGAEPPAPGLDPAHRAGFVPEESRDPPPPARDHRSAPSPHLLAEKAHGAGRVEPCVAIGEEALRAARQGGVGLERPQGVRVEGGDGVAPFPQPLDLAAQRPAAALVARIGPRDHPGGVEPEAPLAELPREGAVVLDPACVQPVVVLPVGLGRRVDPGEARPAGPHRPSARRGFDGVRVEEGDPDVRAGEGERGPGADDAGPDHDRVEVVHRAAGAAARAGAGAGAGAGRSVRPAIRTGRRALRRGIA